MHPNQVLGATLSPDAATRHDAEQQLLQAANADFGGYLTALAHALAEEQNPPEIRTAAGIVLKNAFSAREFARLRELQEKWVQQVDPNVKKTVKLLALGTLASNDGRAGHTAAQFIAAIAAIELPRDQWPDLMATLVQNVNTGADSVKQSSLTTIGFICETDDADLRDALNHHSNAILTAVVQGARKEEPNPEIRVSAIESLVNSLEFVRTNFDNEGERNYIMQIICEATQANDTRVQRGAFGCLNKIMNIYYDKMQFYMEKALFGLTIMGMKSEDEDVAKLAVEFWSTVCEEEYSIDDDNAQVWHQESGVMGSLLRLAEAQSEGSTELRPLYGFARVATPEVVPVLLYLLTKQDEDAADDDYTVSRAAYNCLQLYAQTVGGPLIQPVINFVEVNLRNDDWHNRDAAVSAFGAIMDGPDEKALSPLIKQALPVLIGMMNDKAVPVQDSAAYALGRVCEMIPDAIDPTIHLAPLISALFAGLASNPKMASSCCWALMNLADRFAGEPGCQENPLTKHFQESVGHLLQVTERNDADAQLRTAAYEVLNSFVTNAANDSLPMVAKLSEIVLQRLENTIPMQSQIVSVEDRLMLEEMQTSLVSVLLAIIQRLERQVKPQGDRIMRALLQLLHTVGPNSSVPETVFAAVGALGNALEGDFIGYMDSFVPFMYNALGNQDDPALCSVAIGLVSDITRALGEFAQPYCDAFMNYLLSNLRQSTTLSNQFKPAILQCFGDIAQAIGGHFETYLSVVAQVLQQAATVTANPQGSYEMLDYVISLREGIMDAWGGIVLAMRSSVKTVLLQPYVETIFQLLNVVWQDQNRTENLMRASMGVLGDLAEAFPHGEYANYYRAEWITQMVKDTRANREFNPRTTDTARWAREQVKRQVGNVQGIQTA
ncbi:MAG: karyopherin beta [Phylliscum demangeonii]|nr:MAG: karyopherin beta [Phylliscum demangeonii]